MTDDTLLIENTPLGSRMKRYEHTFRQYLPRRAYTLMRLDGRAFGTYLKDSVKPFDEGFIFDMDTVAVALCTEVQGAEFAYTQSDEISLLLTDFRSLQSELWFGGNIAKILSVSASRAGIVMDRLRRQSRLPEFDCRVWSMTDPVEVANYFLWRQQDAVTNSIQMLAQHYYRPSELFGKSTNELQELLWREQGVNWNDLDAGLKRGRVISHLADGGWQVSEAPHFMASPENRLAALIPPLPSLWSYHG